MKLTLGTTLVSFLLATSLQAEITVQMHSTKNNRPLGYITAKDTPFGVLLMPHLSGLETGMHGFHLHLNASCDNKGSAAGGHFDPKNSKEHLGPYRSDGHLGDLPALYFDKNKSALLPVLAPRLKEADIINHTFIIHEGADNYADLPEPLGGGGKRMACGLVKRVDRRVQNHG